MKRRLSFRARIALLSAGISGFVLAVFALGCFALVRSTDLAAIDRDLVRMGQMQVDHEAAPGHWARLEGAISMLGGPDHGLDMMVIDRAGLALYRSPRWPRGLEPGRFPLPSDAGLAHMPAMPGPMPPPPPPLPGDEGLEPPPRGEPLPTREPLCRTHHADGHSYRVAIVGNARLTLMLAQRLDHFAAGQRQLALGLLVGWLGALLGIGAGGWLVAEQAMRPVHKIAAAAERITATRLESRISTVGMGEEFSRLTRLLNQMLERLQRSFEQANRFSADAAHELRTPLTILQGEIQAAIQEAPAGSDLQGALVAMLDEVHRLAGLVRKLLLLAEADAGELEIDRRRVPLAPLVRDAAEDATTLAPDLAVMVRIDAEAEVMGDRDLLGQVISNLVSNAVRYNRPRGRVGLTLSVSGTEARLLVTNTGPGIKLELQARVFERFFRADPSRTRAAGGAGLGMSLAREIARAHGGDLTLADGRADQTAFALSLPLASAPGTEATPDRPPG